MRIKKIPGPLKGQLQRAASSVALNLAEGWGRATPADRRRFFQIAFGSHREVQAIIQLEPDEFNEEERDILDPLAASVFKLLRNCRVP